MITYYIVLWCRSLSHRYFCLVAVQHSHSGKIGSKKKKNFKFIKNAVLRAAIYKLFFSPPTSQCLLLLNSITSSSCSCPVGQCSRTSSSWQSWFMVFKFRKTYWMLWLLLIFLLSSYYPEMGAPHDTMDGCLQGIQRRPKYK